MQWHCTHASRAIELSNAVEQKVRERRVAYLVSLKHAKAAQDKLLLAVSCVNYDTCQWLG